ncbi:MAG: hypothetical protein BWY59_02537 [Verrucomicrobia bacterium ADurb.Bin345]|nr:MAG: hypothetical protein BWY59_02537 [Verrucomicrobia bacterium ADurb.Bin345]
MREMVGEYDVPNRAPRISYPFLLSVCFGVITLAGSNAMIKARWEHFSHPADVGVRGIGATREEAFQQAALAMMAVITDPQHVTARDVFELELDSKEDDLLLVDWLNRLIYEMNTRGMLFGRFDVWVDTPHLRARVWGEKLSVRKHKPAVEVKAATYHQAAVYQEASGAWIAQCVVDV